MNPPARLGRFRVEALIAQGAMATVHRGIDTSTGATVALKILALASEFGGAALEEARVRFARESQAAARLDHPGIVRILEAGEAEGLAYIAMEFVDGRPLSDHARPGALLPPPDVAGIGARIADALAHAHQQGVIHRDIKPANVLVDPAAGIVKVTDFGIALVTDAARTRTGLMLGTPSYMSPEQMMGGRIDGRSDLYALGVVLFQLLTGALPHASESMARLMQAIVNEPAPDVRSLQPSLPEALAGIVAQALRKVPAQRQANAAELAAGLRAVNW